MANPEIVEIYYFRASAKRPFRPTLVGKNLLYVEIMTGGTVFYEGGKYQRGTVFCHTCGDTTLHDFPEENPYRVLMLLFSNYRKSRRQLPHIGIWRHLEMLDQFVHDALEDFHLAADRKLLSEYLFSALRLNLSELPERQDPLIAKEVYIARKELERFDRPQNWQDFSAYAGYSPSYLRHFFRREFGVSPGRYRLLFRLDTACRLLRETGAPIAEIAEETGFHDLKNFYRMFRKHTGMTPGEYRTENQQENETR